MNNEEMLLAVVAALLYRTSADGAYGDIPWTVWQAREIMREIKEGEVEDRRSRNPVDRSGGEV